MKRVIYWICIAIPAWGPGCVEAGTAAVAYRQLSTPDRVEITGMSPKSYPSGYGGAFGS